MTATLSLLRPRMRLSVLRDGDRARIFCAAGLLSQELSAAVWGCCRSPRHREANFRRTLSGASQLGGVWLPLPHVLMLPFISNMAMWQTGFAAVPMSMVSYALSVAGIWRLARRLMRPRWALVAVAFYALNANLLFLSTTAMTEALFLALLVWTVVATMECVAALRAGQMRIARSRMILAGVLIVGQVFTRYDGWIVGAIVWVCLARECGRAACATGCAGRRDFHLAMCSRAAVVVLVQRALRARLAGLYARALLGEAD